MKFHGYALCLVLGSGLCDLPAQEANKAKTLLAIDDLYRFDAPKTVALSPDGKQVAFVRHWIDSSTKKERHSLWLVKGAGAKAQPAEVEQLDARAPVFSPDGKWIAFLSTRAHAKGWKQVPPVPPESDPAVDLWLLPTRGGPPIPLGGPERPHGRVFHDGFYGRVAFAPDSRSLVFVADDGKDPRTAEEIANDVLIVRPDQGEGYTGYGAAQIWVAELGDMLNELVYPRIRRLTNDDVWYGDPQWSPDGSFLVVHANKTADRESVRFSINKNFDLWALPVAGGSARQLTSGPGPDVSPRFSPDGKTFAFLSIPRKGTHRDVFNLGLVTLGAGGPSTRILFDHHGPQADKPPHPIPAFPLPDDCWEGNDLLLYVSEAGVMTQQSYVRPGDSQGGFVSSAPGKIMSEARAAALKTRQSMTPPGNEFLKDRKLAEGQVVSWKNDLGQQIEGVFTPPTAGSAPHKLIVYPHGGPHGRSTLGFDFTVQIFAAHGYAVFQPNFRGSAGYGQKFIDADRADFGGGDMRDILTGIDELVRKGLVNPKQQYVYGISYGGFMTSWLVGQTNQFRAAAAQNAVTDLGMMWSLSDLQSWTHWEFGGFPWEVPAVMRRHSPLTYAANVKTPTLILHAREDRRCPLPMGRAFHQALVARHVPTQMVIYPGEGHGIRQPRHREDVLRRVLGWFAKYGGE